MALFKYKLGLKVKDKVTGFTGIITARTQYLTGCNGYGITPPVDKDGKTGEWQHFDEGRLEIIDEGINKSEVAAKKAGGPQPKIPEAMQ